MSLTSVWQRWLKIINLKTGANHTSSKLEKAQHRPHVQHLHCVLFKWKANTSDNGLHVIYIPHHHQPCCHSSHRLYSAYTTHSVVIRRNEASPIILWHQHWHRHVQGEPCMVCWCLIVYVFYFTDLLYAKYHTVEFLCSLYGLRLVLLYTKKIRRKTIIITMSYFP